MATYGASSVRVNGKTYDPDHDTTEDINSAIANSDTYETYNNGSWTDIHTGKTSPTASVSNNPNPTINKPPPIVMSAKESAAAAEAAETPTTPVTTTTPVTPTTPTPTSTGMTKEEYMAAQTDYENRVSAAAAAAKQLALKQAWEGNQQALNSQNSTVANNYQSATNALNLALQTQLPKYQAQEDATSSEAAAAQRRTEALNAMNGTYNSGANRGQMQDIDLNRQSALRSIGSDQSAFETSTQNKLSEADAARVAALNDIAEKIALGTRQYNDGTLNLTNQLESDKATNASKAFLDAQEWADRQRQNEIANGIAEGGLTGTYKGVDTIAKQSLVQGNAQFYASLNQSDRQFYASLDQNSKQFYESLGQDDRQFYSSLSQNDRQFTQTFGLNKERLQLDKDQAKVDNANALANLTGYTADGKPTMAQKSLDQASSQFKMTFDQSAEQFKLTYGLSKDQLAAQIAQYGASNAIQMAGIAQSGAQFAANMAMEKTNSVNALTQWAMIYNSGLDQAAVTSGIDAAYKLGYKEYKALPSGSARAIVMPDGQLGWMSVSNGTITLDDDTKAAS